MSAQFGEGERRDADNHADQSRRNNYNFHSVSQGSCEHRDFLPRYSESRDIAKKGHAAWGYPFRTIEALDHVPAGIADVGLSELLGYRKFDILAAYELYVFPDAEREFGEFVTRDRSTAFDVGKHFRVLEAIVNDGLAEWLEMGLERVSTDAGCRLYAFTGYKLKMFLAVHGRALLLVQLSMLGSESERATRTRAVTRMQEFFGI